MRHLIIRPEIVMGFTNIHGDSFPNIQSISFTTDSLFGNLGIYRTETKHHETDYFADESNGVYIYQYTETSEIGFRIYKEFADYHFNGYADDKLISLLVQRQSLVRHTDFPTGVVAKDGYIIGQIIRYYQNAIPFIDFLYDCINLKQLHTLIECCKQIVANIKELYDIGISYMDIHPGNFMIMRSDNSVRIIDFDWTFIRFDDHSHCFEEQLFNNLNRFLHYVSEKAGIDPGRFHRVTSFSDAMRYLDAMQAQIH